MSFTTITTSFTNSADQKKTQSSESHKTEFIVYDINVPYVGLTDETNKATQYPQYMPTWDPIWKNPNPTFYPRLRALDIQPGFGSIVHGVQLNKLSDVGKDELALLISQRKVVVFPNQDIIEDGPASQQEFMKYFGKPNYQPVSGTVPGYPGFHTIHRSGNLEEINQFLERKSTTTLWHQDVSYERQPPGYVMLGLLQGPEVGGDTVFADTAAAYKLISPTFRAFLDGLSATHSSRNMISHTRQAGGLVRKDPVDNVHPLVRLHPVTGEKCLFMNGEFITKIHGLKDGEAKILLDFLLQRIITGHDFRARVKWQPKTIVLFDNRSTLHTAVVDYVNENSGAAPRHIFRLCAMAENPIPVNNSI